MQTEVYALGIGHFTPVIIDLALSCGYKVVGLYHYDNSRTGEYDHELPILGSFEDLFANPIQGKSFLLTMGDNQLRASLLNRIIAAGGIVPTLIHPTAVISQFAKIDPVGVYISPFTCVQADTIVGKGTILRTHVVISHSSIVGEYCFVAGASLIGAYTRVEDYVFVGQGVLSISAKVKTIGKGAFIGAGSLLTKDVPAGAKMVGRPARQVL